MLILYYKPTCAFSQRVIQMAINFNVPLELKDISESETARAELREKGGEEKVPFFVDTETGVSMYESSDIIDYLRELKSTVTPSPVATKPRVHVGGSVCESCEG